MDLSNLISYYKDCYQADTRTLSLHNFFSKKVENRFFLDGKDELLNGNLPYFPVSDNYADDVAKNLALYKKEKVFYCAAFFVIGKEETALRKDHKVCAPLFLYPAQIVTEDHLKYVQIDFAKRVININFLNSFKKEDVRDLYESLVEVPAKIADYGDVSSIKKILEQRLDDFNGDEVVFYPELTREAKIKQLLNPSQLEKRNGLGLLPGIAFGVLKRSVSTQGIITELNQISTSKEYSAPLRTLLSDVNPVDLGILPAGKVPAVLSTSQSSILESVNRNVSTMVIGPPGTGKSFTIAAVAIEFLSKGKSVLIASKTDQAVDVVFNKIEKDLGIRGVAMRAGKSDYKKALKNHLNDLLTNTRRMPRGSTNVEGLSKKLKANLLEIKKYQKRFTRQVENELRWGRYISEYHEMPSLFSRLKLRYIKWRNAQQIPHWQLTKRFLINHVNHIRYSKEIVNLNFQAQVHHALYNSRVMFRDFLKSLSARRSSRQETLFQNIDLDYLLQTFPVWLVNLADVQGVLPLRKEMFDLVIIDEASQCDIASCLPVIQRAKRIMIVGDPKQLRHASFLSRSVQLALQRKNKIIQDEFATHLDYRNTSILDLLNDTISNQNQVCFLDEHFRSKPDIIQFSNREFYNNSLKIMTNVPGKDKAGHLVVVKSEGRRDRKGINEIEAEHLIEKVKCILLEQESMDTTTAQSIGILSPFRDQVEYLGKKINETFDIHSINKHNIACGTAYSFQGEERDIMLISFAIDDASHHSAILHLNKPDVFNVSITRARTKQYLFTSFSDNFNPGQYLSIYLNNIKLGANDENAQLMKVRDYFLDAVKVRLEQHQFETWVGYSIAGLFVDMVFKSNGKFYGINHIGYPGMFVDALTVEDYEILSRAGLPTFPLPYSYWKFEEEKCFVELMNFSKS